MANDAEKAHEAYKQSLADLNAYQKKFEADMLSLLARLQVWDYSIYYSFFSHY